MRQVEGVNVNAKVVGGAGGRGVAMAAVGKGGGEAVGWVIGSAGWSPDVHYPRAHELFARLKAFMGGVEPSYHAIRSYAGAIVAADALRRATTLTPEGIRETLLATRLTTPFGTVEFKDFNGFHNQNPLPSILMQVQRNKYVTVWPPDVAVGKVIYPTPVWTARK